MRATLTARCGNASAAVFFDAWSRVVSRSLRHRQFEVGENLEDMDARQRRANVFFGTRLRTEYLTSACALTLMTKWFPSTRLETRTKESNICASSWVTNLLA